VKKTLTIPVNNAGEINDANVDNLLTALAAFAGKICSVTIQNHKRTNRQNRYLHAIFNEVAEFQANAGRVYSARVWKEYFKEKYLPIELEGYPDGTERETIKSTAQLTTAECAEFADKIRNDEAILESGQYIPTPEQMGMLS